jgi:hypothetical protein
MSDRLTAAQAAAIATDIEYRQERFKEPLGTSVLVVLLNFGSEYTRVECVRGEWHGTKADLRDQAGTMPHCPNLHPMIELPDGRRGLGLVDIEAGA